MQNSSYINTNQDYRVPYNQDNNYPTILNDGEDALDFMNEEKIFFEKERAGIITR